MTKPKMVQFSPIDVAIYSFGGVNILAALLGVAGSTVSRWRDSKTALGKIPAKYIDQIISLAESRNIKMGYKDLVVGRIMAQTKDRVRCSRRSDKGLSLDERQRLRDQKANA